MKSWLRIFTSLPKEETVNKQIYINILCHSISHCGEWTRYDYKYLSPPPGGASQGPKAELHSDVLCLLVKSELSQQCIT